MMHTFLISLLLAFSINLIAQNYTPDWESLDTRPTPDWFSEAKFGIFVHWGVYSVPAYRPFSSDIHGYTVKKGTHSSWYIPEVMYHPEANQNFHNRVYGKDFSYFDFANQFRAELFDPEEWVRLFKGAGAQYVVLTAKNGDGFALWPSKEKYSKDWNAGEKGPKRDLVGDLTIAVKKAGLHMGLYYSFSEFWTTKTNIWPSESSQRNGYYVPRKVWENYAIPDSAYTERIHFHTKELINNYKPDIFWTDGELDYKSKDLRSKELLTWIYNEAPNKEWIAVNDRWEKGSRGIHGGFTTIGYGNSEGKISKNKAWEESVPMTYSYAYNRIEKLEDYKSTNDILKKLVKNIGKGGNLLLGVGPSADGSIPLEMQQKLIEIGEWMKKNGEALFETEAYTPEADLWTINPQAGENILFTHNDNYVYVILTDWKIDALNLKNFNFGEYSTAVWLDTGDELVIDFHKSSLIIELPPVRNKKVSIIRLENITEKPEKVKKKKVKTPSTYSPSPQRGQGKGRRSGSGTGVRGGGRF